MDHDPDPEWKVNLAGAMLLLFLVYFAQHACVPGRNVRVLHRAWLQARAEPPFPPKDLKEIYAVHDLRGKDKPPRTPFECPDLYSY